MVVKKDMEHKIIDFHTHPFLTEKENLCKYKEDMHLDMNGFRHELEQAGIVHVCGSVIQLGVDVREEGFEHIKALNRKALEIKKVYGDFYTPGFHVHPDYVVESCEEIVFMHQQGVNLIGELVPYLHGWDDYSCKGLQEILSVAEEYGMIVSYHTMDDDQMTAMVAAHPKLKFVAAHPGEMDKYMKHLDRIAQYDNVYLDLSGTGLFRFGMLTYGVKRVGAGRILFGSDYPICNPYSYIQAVLHEHISDDDRERILYLNAKQLLNM